MRNFDSWYKRLISFYRKVGYTEKSLKSFDKEAYRVYFDSGYSVKEAVYEEAIS